MSDKPQNTIPFSQHIVSLVCVAIISAGGTYQLNKIYQQREAEQAVVYFPHGEDLSKVNATYETILSSYVGDLKKDELVDGAIKGMTEALKDPYSDYLSGTDAEDVNEMIDGSFEGIGATMTSVDGFVKIAEPPIKDSPAEKALLQVDDMILKVDGTDIKGLELTEVVTKIRGEKGTDVQLTVKRGDETFDTTLTRDTIPLESVFSQLDKTNKEVGSIRVSTFSRTTTADFYQAVVNLRKEGAKSFIIDLRQNPGGMLTEVEKMASMFLEDGEIVVQFEEKDEVRHQVLAGKELDGGFKIKEPTVVLVNENSASAAEIMAASLNQSAGIEVIGTKTYGKGTIQSVQSLTQSSELKLTTGKWLTPKGDWVNEKGFEPSIKVDYPAYYKSMPIDTYVTFNKQSKGVAVSNINLILNGLGYETEAKSETYSEKTVTAVKAYQKSKGLPETGEINAETAVSLQVSLIEKMKNETDVVYQKGLDVLTK